MIPLPGKKTLESQRQPDASSSDAVVSKADEALARAITETSANLGRWMFHSLEAVAAYRMAEQRDAIERAKMDHEFRMRMLEKR